MDAKPTVLNLGDSQTWNGLRFYRDGQLVPLEEALRHGFTISPEDAPCIASLAERFVRTRDENTI